MTDIRLRGETILILANAEWDWANRVNCHHVAARLANENQVIFVDTVGGRTPAPREFGKVARRLRRIAGGVRRIQPGLTVLAPFVFPIYNSGSIRKLNTMLLAQQVRRALPSGAHPIVWIFLPSLVGLVDHLKAKLVIYHCVDQHAANPNVPARQVNEWEERLLRAADLVLTTSNTLFEEKRALNGNTYYLPNVADAEFFGQAGDPAFPIAKDLSRVPRPIAGYIGNISAYKMDFDLLVSVAQENPAWSFVLVGPIGRGDPSTDVSKLEKHPNIRLMGERPYSELPQWVKGFDACLIPFNQNDSTRGSLPMKFFEYLAAGKPVISTDLPTLAEFRDYFYPVANVKEFTSALAAVKWEDAARRTARAEIAAKYSWDARMRDIERIVVAALSRGRSQQRQPTPVTLGPA